MSSAELWKVVFWGVDVGGRCQVGWGIWRVGRLVLCHVFCSWRVYLRVALWGVVRGVLFWLLGTSLPGLFLF